jgi:hypothetical protein
MAFAGRWLAVMAVAFVMFPVAFVLWNGPDADVGLLGGMVLMMFLQFISPLDLWLIPFGAGTVIALAWHVVARRKALRQVS